jgi:hypothetical protein
MGSGNKIWEARYRIHDSGCGIWDIGYKMQEYEF